MWQCKQCYLEISDFHANSLTLAGCYLRFLFVLTLNSVLEVALVENSSDEQNTEEVRHHSNHHDHHRQKTKIKLRLENIKLLSVTSSTSHYSQGWACLPAWSYKLVHIKRCGLLSSEFMWWGWAVRPRGLGAETLVRICPARLNWFDFQPNTSSMTLLSGK